MSQDKTERTDVFWEGDALEVLRAFPSTMKRNFGREIQRLQEGEKPLDSRPMKSIGQGVFELRQSDDDGWYRLVYFKKIAGRLFMLHCFVKKSAKTSRKDLNIAKNRLKQVQARSVEEKRDAKKRK